MDVSPSDIKLILSTLQDSEFDQAEVVIGDVRIAVARNGGQLGPAQTAPVTAATVDATAVVAPVATAPVPTTSSASAAGPASSIAAAAPAAPSESTHTIESPSVGVFWRAAAPGAAPFVEVGQEVTAGDTIGIVEVMKLMNNISAGVDGVVTAIHVENAGAVEFGVPLVSIEPKA